MTGLDTSQPMTDEVSLHAEEHHAHSLSPEEADRIAAGRPARDPQPDAAPEQ